jgi:hypothetical protein
MRVELKSCRAFKGRLIEIDYYGHRLIAAPNAIDETKVVVGCSASRMAPRLRSTVSHDPQMIRCQTIGISKGAEMRGDFGHSEFDEQRGSNMTDAPELHLTGPKLHRRVDLAVDGDELAVSPNLDVLDKEEPLLQTP